MISYICLYIYIVCKPVYTFTALCRPARIIWSILAQYHYAYIIKSFEAKGVMFRMYMYVPENHPETNEVFYEREDEAHLIKVTS